MTSVFRPASGFVHAWAQSLGSEDNDAGGGPVAVSLSGGAPPSGANRKRWLVV